MNLKRRSIPATAARLGLAAVFLLSQAGPSLAANTAGPISIPTSIVDLTILAGTTPSIDPTTTFLVKWRQGTPNVPPVQVSAMTFQYLTGTNIALPTRTNPKDNSANNQNDLWSDNAIQLTYTGTNQINQGILIYTDNVPNDANDPLNLVSLRGGLVGGAGSGNPDDSSRASVVPLLWKAVQSADLSAVSNANTNGSVPIPGTSIVYMPTEIPSLTGGACPAEGPYAAVNRTNNGFCDFSTHYLLDETNTDPKNLWFSNITNSTAKAASFYYSSLVGPFGVSTSESGTLPGARYNPMYALLGVSLPFAVQTKYQTTINVAVFNY